VRALAKLEAATGSASAGTTRIQVLIDEGTSREAMAWPRRRWLPADASTCVTWSQGVTSPQSATSTRCG
jgi:hypothetical protein